MSPVTSDVATAVCTDQHIRMMCCTCQKTMAPHLVELFLDTTGAQTQKLVILLHHLSDEHSHLLVVLSAHSGAEVDVVGDQITADLVPQQTHYLLSVPER